jgi:hypothetical protein
MGVCQNPPILTLNACTAQYVFRAVRLRHGTERQAAVTQDAVDHSRLLITRADDIPLAINAMRAIAPLLRFASRRRPLIIRR